MNFLINTLEKNYAYTWLKNIDWNEIKEKYIPLVSQNKTRQKHYALLTNILQELQDSHCLLINPAQYKRFNSGFKIKEIEGRFLVTAVTKRSPAYKAGVRKGFELTMIGESPIPALLEEFRRNIIGSPQWTKAYSINLLSTIKKDPKGNYLPRSFHFKNKKNEAIIITIQPQNKTALMERSYWKWEAETPMVWHRKMKNNIGYIKVNGFRYKEGKKRSVSAAFGKIVKKYAAKKAKALIIDLRDTNGGYGEEVCKMFSYFVPDEILLRQTCYPKSKNCIVKSRKDLILTHNYKTYPDLFTYDGQVVLLTNSYCRSGCDMFAAAFKMTKRGYLIGQTTAGAGGTSKCERLPSGAPFCYTNWPVVLANGNVVEGVGVKPDLKLKQSLRDFTKGQDTLLNAALKHIEINN